MASDRHCRPLAAQARRRRLILRRSRRLKPKAAPAPSWGRGPGVGVLLAWVYPLPIDEITPPPVSQVSVTLIEVSHAASGTGPTPASFRETKGLLMRPVAALETIGEPPE